MNKWIDGLVSESKQDCCYEQMIAVISSRENTMVFSLTKLVWYHNSFTHFKCKIDWILVFHTFKTFIILCSHSTRRCAVPMLTPAILPWSVPTAKYKYFEAKCNIFVVLHNVIAYNTVCVTLYIHVYMYFEVNNYIRKQASM